MKARDRAGEAHAEATDAPDIPTPTCEAPHARAEAMRAHPYAMLTARERARRRAIVPKSAAPPPMIPSATASTMLDGAAGIPRAAIHEGARVYACTPPLVEARAGHAAGRARMET